MKKAVSFIVAVVLLLSLSVAVFASTGTKTAQLAYRDIKVSLDGRQFTPKDAAGNVVEPFIIDGTTYLPVRAVAEALNLNVEWDNATSTVKLTRPEGSRPVYITATGKRYHYDSTCNGGTYWEVPLSSAVGMGLTPCDKCVIKGN